MVQEVLMETLRTTSLIFVSVYTLASTYTLGKNKIILKRNSKYNKRLVKNFHVTKNLSIEELKKIIDKDKIKVLLPYIEKLEKNTSKENLYSLYRNLKNIKIKKNLFILLRASSGEYDSLNNTIEIISNTSLGHEFLHLASSYYIPKLGLDLSGFEQYSFKDKVLIGTGLNEGYTELLAARLYNHNKYDIYKQDVKIAMLLELFFNDSKDMEKYYFNHDLSGFIDYMEKYTDRKTITKLILDIDSLHRLIEPMKSYYSVKIQLELYKIFRSKCKNTYKLEKFKNLVYKNKIVKMLLKSKNLDDTGIKRVA